MSAARPDRRKTRKPAGSKRSRPLTAAGSEAPNDAAAPRVHSADTSVLESLGAAISQPLRDAADDSIDRSSSTSRNPPDERLR
jgi:hypothetical protein